MCCFFFQAEDGIRDIGVTGVQTCALPISDGLTDWVFGYASLVDRPGAHEAELRGFHRRWNAAMDNSVDLPGYKHYLDPGDGSRSEERRVGKECRSRWSPYH